MHVAAMEPLPIRQWALNCRLPQQRGEGDWPEAREPSWRRIVWLEQKGGVGIRIAPAPPLLHHEVPVFSNLTPVWLVQVLCGWTGAMCQRGFRWHSHSRWDRGQSKEEEVLSPSPPGRPTVASCTQLNGSITHGSWSRNCFIMTSWTPKLERVMIIWVSEQIVLCNDETNKAWGSGLKKHVWNNLFASFYTDYKTYFLMCRFAQNKGSLREMTTDRWLSPTLCFVSVQHLCIFINSCLVGSWLHVSEERRLVSVRVATAQSRRWQESNG